MKTLKTPEEIIKQESFLKQLTPIYSHEFVELLIESAQRDALEVAAENAKTIKTGNSGSWFDASVDKESILNLIPK